MRKMLCFCLLFISLIARSQSSDTISVVSWNIEWFGSPSNGPSDDNLQEQNVIKILRYLNADIYGLCEVVDTMRLRRVTDSLGSNYAFYISYFGSIAPSPTSPNWYSAQKLAFIYRKDVFSNIRTRAMLNNGSQAYVNFASGRFPYLFNANVSKGGKKRNVSFILIHAKSGATSTDYNKRKDGASELKDSLNLSFTNHPAIIMGDLNDELEGCIVSGYSVSPYDIIVRDSIRTNPNYYNSISLIPERAGERSTISYSNVIDHQVINKKMDSMYVPGSIKIRQDVTNVVPTYLSRNTSDHFPVFSRYKLITGDTTSVIINPTPTPVYVFSGFTLGPNPFTSEVYFRSGQTLRNVAFSLYNVTGQKLWSLQQSDIPAQVVNSITLPQLPTGMYLLNIKATGFDKTFKLVKL